MLRSLACWLLLMTGVAAFSQTAPANPPAERPAYGGKLKPEQANIDVKHYTIDLAVDIPGKAISGYAVVALDILQPTKALLFDLMDSFTVSRVLVNDRPARFTHDHHEIHIMADKDWAAGPATVRVDYSGHPMIARRPPWDDGFTFTTDSAGHPWVAVTAEG